MSFVFKDSMYDPAVLELVHDPDQVPVYRRLTGLIGPGNTDEKIRIYTWDLSGHVEVAKSDVVYIEKMPNGEGAIVFLKGGSQDQQSAIQNAYLQGQMTQAVQTVLPPTIPPWTCPTIYPTNCLTLPPNCPTVFPPCPPPPDNEAKVTANQVGAQTFPTWLVGCQTLMPGCRTSYPTGCPTVFPPFCPPPHDDQAKVTTNQQVGAMTIPTIFTHCPTIPVTRCLNNQANVTANQTTGGPAAMAFPSFIPTVCAACPSIPVSNCPTIDKCPSVPVTSCHTIPNITC